MLFILFFFFILLVFFFLKGVLVKLLTSHLLIKSVHLRLIPLLTNYFRLIFLFLTFLLFPHIIDLISFSFIISLLFSNSLHLIEISTYWLIALREIVLLIYWHLPIILHTYLVISLILKNWHLLKLLFIKTSRTVYLTLRNRNTSREISQLI